MMKDEQKTTTNDELMADNDDNVAKLVGSYVRIEPPSSNPRGGFLLGKVSSFDVEKGLFSVFFEDCTVRFFDRAKLVEIVLSDDGGSGVKLSVRKRKLDNFLSVTPPSEFTIEENRTLDKLVISGVDVSGGCDSSSSDDAEELRDDVCSNFVEAEMQVQVVELPPSSGDLAVPEESVACLFSVYNFLRSFSIELFLSPFSLYDFIGSINCTTRNSLLDAVHVVLLRAVRRHLQDLSSEGSESASRCLRYQDWSLLDQLTWPVFLVEYLFSMGYMKGHGRKKFGIILSESHYYKLSPTLKLEVLQMLCDDVIGSQEFRTELETRENMDEETDNMDASLLPDSRPKRVPNRLSKSASSQEKGNFVDSTQPNEPGLVSGAAGPDSGVSNSAPDSNSDECRLCGMDGTLVCCDGCPSAYHSRCIGLYKAFLPAGNWFCPECTIDKLGPTSSKIGRGIKGAEVFGIDPCGRMFLGTCNYLLVIGTIMNEEPFARYYNESDAYMVLNSILAFSYNGSLYMEICEGAFKYWNFPLACIGKTEPGLVDKQHRNCDHSDFVTSVDGTNDVSKNAMIENQASNTAEISAENGDQKPSLLDTPSHSVFPNPKNCDKTNENNSMDETKVVALESLPSLNNELCVSNNLAVHKVLSVVHMNLNHQLDDVSASGKISVVRDITNCASENDKGSWKVNANSSCSSVRSSSATTSNGLKLGSQISISQHKTMGTRTLNNSVTFKPQGYVNLYIQGDIAASAAANYAVLTSEENKPSEIRASSNPKKIASINTTLQMKAFSEASLHFLWPSSEKKLMDIPRERCGWCIACRSTVTYRKGCFLNLAAANAVKGSASIAKGNATIAKGTAGATKGSSKNSSGTRPAKHDDTQFSIIATHIVNMEDNLHGLISGSLLDANYVQQWRNELREASSCRALKSALLELERNLRGIAFTESWYKLVDDGGTVAASVAVVGASCSASAQKRPGRPGRRAKKASVAEVVVAPSDKSGKDIQWWRGKLQKFVCHIGGSLPSKLIRKAARQGGAKRVAGLCYVENCDPPRRTRQLAWQASVEMCKNASQLALQVRYLDAHIRWKDILRPDQSSIESKSSDLDSSIFRNAVICGKKVSENKIFYALTFPNQKHLPSRVTKNIFERETLNGEHVKLWFSENYVPLYLIKEYEEKDCSNSIQSTPALSLHAKLGRKLPKNQNSVVFAYLVCRRDGPSTLTCPSCKQDVFLRDSATCGICQGSCHKDCTLPLIDRKRANLSYIVTCKICYHAKTAALNASRKEIMNVQLPLKRKDDSLQLAAKMKVDPDAGSLVSDLEIKNGGRRSGSCPTTGLVWKRKNDRHSGQSFRQKHLILKNTGVNTLTRPTCCLCRQPYRSDLMYLCCEKCSNWYHADALNVEEHQIFDLVGFRCCKNRKNFSLQCPYVDPNYTKTFPESSNDAIMIAEMSQPAKLERPFDSFPCYGKEDASSVEDPLVNSSELGYPIWEQMQEFKVELDGYELLPENHEEFCVRTQINHGAGLDSSLVRQERAIGVTDYSINQSFERNDAHGDRELPAGNVLHNADDNSNLVNQWHEQENGSFEDMEYEPQTYFSFTELLASEEGQPNQSDGLNEATDNGLLDLSFDDSIISFEDMPLCIDPFESETLYYEFACSKCKLNQPSPDLKCEICGLLIHSHCSPWVENEESFSCTSWRCGNCRDWR